MDLRVRGAVPPDPFLSARDVFETEHDLEKPVWIEVRADPEERTWTGHHEDYHTLNISRQAATSAMARELALHEYAHMRRHEEAHPSHVQSMEEVLYLALAGREVKRRRIAHCYQIANHVNCLGVKWFETPEASRHHERALLSRTTPRLVSGLPLYPRKAEGV